MARHTPGPWRWEPDARDDEHRKDRLVSDGPGPLNHDDVLTWDTDEPVGDAWVGVSEADARLIAAAPELADALEELVDLVKVLHEHYQGEDAPYPEELDRARAALKAAGRGE